MAPRGIVPFEEWVKGHRHYDRFVLQLISAVGKCPNVCGFSFYSEIELYGKAWNAHPVLITEETMVDGETSRFLKNAFGPLTGIVIADAFLVPEYYSLSLFCIPIDYLRLVLR